MRELAIAAWYLLLDLVYYYVVGTLALLLLLAIAQGIAMVLGMDGRRSGESKE